MNEESMELLSVSVAVKSQAKVKKRLVVTYD